MLKFTKMHGLGNDYVYMNAISQTIENRSELAKYVSDRHFGIGSDGLILICPSDKADFRMQMFNSDGSEAEMCGNGIRCVGKFVYDNGLTDKDVISVETLAGIKILNLNVVDGKVETVRVDMGEPILDPQYIPVVSNKQPVKNLMLKAEDREFRFTCVSMGNPHAITFIEDDLKQFDVVFPITHGTNGEDGKLQGMLELFNIPYVGCGILSSSICMDKAYAKVIFDKAGIKQAKYIYINRTLFQH